MSEIMNINSSKGLVKFSREDLIDLDLIKWIRTSHRGQGTQRVLSETPFEKAAATVYHEKYPSQIIKIAEKILVDNDGSVSVILRVAESTDQSNLYNIHPTEMVLSKNTETK